MSTVKIPGFTSEASLCETRAPYPLADVPDNLIGGRRVLPQLANETYTTRQVCEACGCTASDVACDCGMPPSQRKLNCINNGGPARTLPVSSPVRLGGGIFRAS